MPSSTAIINVNITIATDLIIKSVPSPSTNPNNPTQLNSNFMYMVASGSAMNIVGQGGQNLDFTAMQGDVIRFYGTSEYNNYDNPIIIYEFKKISGDNIFDSPFELENFDARMTEVPVTFNPLTVRATTQDFWFAQNTVNHKGTENYTLRFALYTIPRGATAPQLYGYFQWDPTIRAK